MDLRKLKKLIDLVQESGIAELEITEGEERVRITHAFANNAPIYAQPQMMMPGYAMPGPAPVAGPAAPVVAAEPAAPDGHVVQVAHGRHVVPCVRAPGAKAFAEVGQTWSRPASPCASSRP
jgi:acetyl-CoA carboxylase biotin carboxyl carrier protein